MPQEKKKSAYRPVMTNFLMKAGEVLGFKFDGQSVKRSGLFDADWYLANYPDIAETKMDPLEHYLKIGGFAGRCPGPNFDSQWYLNEYPDVVLDKMNPLVHYIRYGKQEGRKTSSPNRLETGNMRLQDKYKTPLVLMGYLESVVYNSGILKLKGWVLLGKKVKKIDAYFNDLLLEPTQGSVCFGKEREDVEKTYPLIEESLYSGFEALFHIDPLLVSKDGAFTIKLRVIDNEGRYGELRKSITGGSSELTEATVLGNDILMCIDAMMYCSSGTMLIIGWIDDRKSPLSNLIVFAGQKHAWDTTVFGRISRTDLDPMMGIKSHHQYGFWSVVTFKRDLPIGSSCVICGQLADGRFGQISAKPQFVSETELRARILAHFVTIDYSNGNPGVENFRVLDSGIGSGLIELNRKITASVAPGAWVSYYGPMHKSYDGSVIVCVYGKQEFLFLQSALFSSAAGSEKYEFVFVSNSPELAEGLEKEARICARIYGVSIVLVCLPDNIGFGPANNVAARFARSKRLMFTNPDVFPRDNDWARRHSDIIKTAPKDQTLIFGAPLYYDDGSLMHHGIYFTIDAGISMAPQKISSLPMVRAEHYAKGAPSWSNQFICPRPVPAITGAFISIDRDWFEALGGFNEDYLFGHYEDLDLCLKSLVRGKPAWIHDFPMWHMEGKGSVKQTEHEVSSLFNRWLFTRKWSELIASELLGPEPSCTALRVPTENYSDLNANSNRGVS